MSSTAEPVLIAYPVKHVTEEQVAEILGRTNVDLSDDNACWRVLSSRDISISDLRPGFRWVDCKVRANNVRAKLWWTREGLRRIVAKIDAGALLPPVVTL